MAIHLFKFDFGPFEKFLNFVVEPRLRDFFEQFFPIVKPAPQPTIAEIASSNGSFDILVAALTATDLVDAFDDADGSFTVFAPTDAAFTELAITLGVTVDGLSETEIATAIIGELNAIGGSEAAGLELLAQVLTYHVVDGEKQLTELQAEGATDTLNGAMIEIDGDTLVDKDPEVENPEFIDGLTDIQASNGVIQAIDRVLLPIDIAEAVAQPTIADIAAANGSFDILVAALQATGLDGVVADRAADFTVFAPTDAAFTELAITLGVDVAGLDESGVTAAIVAKLSELAGSDAAGLQLLSDVLLYHVKVGGAELAELQAAGSVATVQGDSIGVAGRELIDADPEVQNPMIIEGLTDIEAANGVIQAIDRVLLPIDIPEAVAEPTIADLVVAVSGDQGFDVNAGDFDILREALVATDLLGAVADREAALTVFAPTDSAFGQLAGDLGFEGDVSDEAAVFEFLADATGFVSAADPGLLDDILLYHVSPGETSLDALRAEGTAETLFGAPVAIKGNILVDADPSLKNPTFVTGATDIEAANGVIQAIDGVLAPVDLPDAPAEVDKILGGKRGEKLVGDADDEKIFGFGGRDTLLGAEGDDHLFGGRGRDRLEGGEGDDHLFGGRGRDHLDGGAGDDFLVGGAGRDMFDFRDLEGDDVIGDLSKRDTVVFSNDDFASFEALEAAAVQTDAGVLIQGEDGSVLIEHSKLSRLDKFDFDFV